MSQTIHRTSIPVDDETHMLPCSITEIVHVDCRDLRAVEVWHRAPSSAETPVRVFGTGHQVLDSDTYLGTALTPATGATPRGALVWHLWAVA